MKQALRNINGFEIFFEGISYNCPVLKLWGYESEQKLINAIKRKLKPKAALKRWKAD